VPGASRLSVGVLASHVTLENLLLPMAARVRVACGKAERWIVSVGVRPGPEAPIELRQASRCDAADSHRVAKPAG